MALTRTEVSQLHLEVDAAIQDIAGRHGLSCASGKMRYDDSQCYMKIEFKTAMAMKEASAALNLPSDVIGRIFELRGISYKIVQLKPERPKFPIIAERMSDGRKFKFQSGVVKNSQ